MIEKNLNPAPVNTSVNKVSASGGKSCYNCGGPWQHANSKPCPAYGKSCGRCGEKNHFSKMCASRKKFMDQRKQK